MKIAILECSNTKTYDRATVIDAHLRNSQEIADYLNAELIVTENDYKKALKKKYDVLISGYASYYALHRTMDQIAKNNLDAKFFQLSNEYTLRVLSWLKLNPAGYDLISNFDYTGKDKNLRNQYTLNLNLLLAKPHNPKTKKKYDCIYFGTFRPNRSKYFSEYLQSPLYLSTSTKNFKKYKHVGCKPIWVDKLSWSPKRETLNLFKYSLYIEDIHTHKIYNHLGNRFYEALFCNVIQFFDINCKNTIDKSGIDFDNQFYVRNHKELMAKINDANSNKAWDDLWDYQKKWNIQALEQRETMLNDLKKIIYREISN
jgi:hypothetical protein